MILQFTARTLPGVDALTQGAGVLNVNGALALSTAINPTARPGRTWLRYTVPAVNLDGNGKRVAWGQKIIYGDRFVPSRYAGIHLVRWDDNIVWGNNADENIVWGNNIVRGNANVVQGYWASKLTFGFWDDNIVWGNDDDNIVWGNCSNANDDNIVWGNGDDDNIVWGNAVLTSLGGGR